MRTAPSGLTWTMTPPSPPGNWFPLLPIVVGRLALGALWNARTQKPPGACSPISESPRLLHQEEVPPEGAQVVRRWQSARAIDGSLHFWIGRSKTPRRNRHRAGRPVRRRRVEVATCDSDECLEAEAVRTRRPNHRTARSA